MVPAKLAFVDVETTGTTPANDRIIEIGILRTEGDEIISTFKSLVNPETSLSPFIEEMTGIKAVELERAPTFSQIRADILEILDGCVFVAHNVRFDYGFLKNEFARCEMAFSSKHFCTVRLSRFLFPRFHKHDLNSIISRFSLSCPNRHRAYDDAHVLWQFYKKLKSELDAEKFGEAIRWALRQPARPLNLPAEKIDNLPESPGVYIFHGEMPLYVGKSKNIRERVLSHFANDHGSTTDMKLMQETVDVETVTTAGELGALLTESEFIKKLQPLYNRLLRNARKVTALVRKTTKGNYDRAYLCTLDGVNPNSLENVLATFKSAKQAKDTLAAIAKEYHLCMKLLGLESGKGACFGCQLGTCKGACENAESVAAYNLRFLTAFAHTKVKKWPFEGPITITEENQAGQKETFTIDKWCVVKSEIGNREGSVGQKQYTFDVDVYKILKRYLTSSQNLKHVETIHQGKITTLHLFD